MVERLPSRPCAECGQDHNWDSPWCARCKHMTFGHVPGGSRPYIGPAETPAPSWERGIVMEKRGDGEVPLLDESLRPIRVKKYAENRHKYEDLKRKRHQ